jgi:hypothetical protein
MPYVPDWQIYEAFALTILLTVVFFTAWCVNIHTALEESKEPPQ